MKAPQGFVLRPAAVTWLAIVLGGCGLLTPTPARHRPPLPEPEPMPDLAAEEVVDQLTALGFECWFDPGGDIPPSWNCRKGNQGAADYFAVRISSEESGPIDSLSAYRQLEGPDALALDAAGTDSFQRIVALIVPEEHRPALEKLRAGVQSNYPMELGGGWYLGFDRNSISRSLHIVHASDPG